MTTTATSDPVDTATYGGSLLSATARLRASGSPTPRLDAEVLLAFVVGTDRTTVLAHPERPLDESAAERLRTCITRREGGEPVAYIRGHKEFRGLRLAVDGRVLIPRPETEQLVDLALECVAAVPRPGARRTASFASGRDVAARGPDLAPRQPGRVRALRVVDVGTGSGAVAVALAVALRDRGLLGEVEILATDISVDALAVAAANAAAYGLAGRIRFVEADLLPATSPGGSFDILLANLPYVRRDELPSLPVAAAFEPVIALDGGPDGLAVVRRLLDRIPLALTSGGVAFIEIGSDDTEAALVDAEARLPGRSLRIHRDLAGLARVLEIGPAGGAVGRPAAEAVGVSGDGGNGARSSGGSGDARP